MKSKIAVFTTLFLLMGSFVGWIFYMSEPKYIDNPKSGAIELYDYVSIRPYDNLENYLWVGLVLQIDSTSFNNHYALIKTREDDYRDVLIGTTTPSYKVIGKGTFYHKVNAFVGFNIVMITTGVIIILMVVILIALIGMVREFLGYY